MEFKIYKKIVSREGKSVRYDEIILECEGSGKEEDPIIIEPSDNLPDGFHIFIFVLFFSA